jgi:hypothetical protein
MPGVAFPPVDPMGHGSPPSPVLCSAKTATLSLLGRFACRSLPDTLPATVRSWYPRRARRRGGSPPTTPGPLVTRSPSPGLASRRQMALPRSRVPLGETCPALRPRWCPASSLSRTQDCGLPVRANRRHTTTLHMSGLHHAACLLATPGSVRPLAGRHAGSLLTGWLSFHQVGLEPYCLAPTGKQPPSSWAYAQFQGFGLTLARASRARKGEFVRCLDHFDLLQTAIN